MAGLGTNSRRWSRSAEALSGASPRTLATFFDELNEWSEIKLRVLEKYFDAYLRYRGKAQPKVFYVDGCAGTGRYGADGADQREGSPVRMAKFAQRRRDEGKPCQLVCINTEINPDFCRELRDSLAGFDPALVRVRDGAFQDHLASILREMGDSPAVFFLDPFGVKQMRMADMNPLLRRPDTELLLNLNTPRLRMLAGFEDSASKDARAKVALVSEVLGEGPTDPDPAWLREWRRLRDPIRWERWAADAYRRELVGRSPHLRRAFAYPVREAVGANPKYYLIFASRSDEAILVMNDLVCSEDDDLFERSESIRADGQASFFRVLREDERESRVRAVLENIYSYGSANQGCTREDVIRHFVLEEERFGELRKKHYRAAIDILVRQGRAKFAGKAPKDEDAIRFA
jgi:three-Cys-motif partner protein